MDLVDDADVHLMKPVSKRNSRSVTSERQLVQFLLGTSSEDELRRQFPQSASIQVIPERTARSSHDFARKCQLRNKERKLDQSGLLQICT